MVVKKLEMSSRTQVLALYKSLIRESKKFPSYNYRHYALRRVRDAFRTNKTMTDPSQIAEEVKKGFSNLEIIKRQVLIGELYRTDKLVIENVSSKV